MELRHLRYFVAVAEEQNVSRAAKRLHVSQPSLSRQIRDLEHEIGVVLFEHGSRSIQLTEAGRLFLSEAKAALLRVDEAVAFTQAVAQRKRNRLRVGYAAVPNTEVLPLVLAEFQRTNPQAKVDLRAMTTKQMVSALRSGDVDVSLLPYFLQEDFHGLATEVLASYPIRVVTSKKHRFAELAKVPIGEVAKEPIISLSRDSSPWYYALIENLLSPHKNKFTIAEEYESSQSVIAAVEAGRGVAIAYSIVARATGERLAFLPLVPEPPPLPVVVAYRREAVSSLANAFITAARIAKLT